MSHENSSHESIKAEPVIEIQHLEIMPTDSPVLGMPAYFDKAGLRIEGDGVDHNQYNPLSLPFIMTVLGCSSTMAGAVIAPLLYLTLGTTIASDLNAGHLTSWLFTALIISTGALAPFIGPLSDLIGRRSLLLAGIVGSTLGAVVCGSTPTAGGFIAGQILIGCGIVTQELLAMAVISEIVPTAKRGVFAALMLCMIVPWSPSTLYANWMAQASWRWVSCVIAGWNTLSFALIAFFYHPPPRVNSLGLSRREMIGRIDFVGGLLITLGSVLFLIALNWGGQQYPWTSVQVLSLSVIGFCVMISFGLWEMYGARYPLFPRRIIQAPRPFYCLLTVIFMAGINFVPLVVFWPIQSISVYGSDHFQTGINTLPIGLCITGGAMVSALLLGRFKRRITMTMTIFCIIQTVASACLTVIDPHDIRTAWAPLVFALVGVGGVLVPNQIVITIITPDDLIASVTALTVALRAQAQVIGLAIFFNRFMSDVQANALKFIVPAMDEIGVHNRSDIFRLATGLTAMPLSQFQKQIPLLQIPANYDLVREATIQCFSQSLLPVYYIMIGFGVVACIAAAFMGDVSKYMDNHVAVVI